MSQFNLSTGYVGIGTTNPSTLLDVNGVATFKNDVLNTSGRPILKQSGSVINTWNNYTSLVDLTSATNYVLISVTVTPSSTSSKFLITAGTSASREGGTSNQYIMGYLRRNSTSISFNFISAIGYSVNTSVRQSGSISLIDSPNTISSITYDVYIDLSVTAPSIRFIYFCPYITVQEIAA